MSLQSPSPYNSEPLARKLRQRNTVPSRQPLAEGVRNRVAFVATWPAGQPSVRSSLVASPIAVSVVVVDVLEKVRRYAESNTPVVLVGETGTRKSYLARLLHELSGRSGAFAEITAGGLGPELGPSQPVGPGGGAVTRGGSQRGGLFGGAASGAPVVEDFHLLRSSLQDFLVPAFDL